MTLVRALGNAIYAFRPADGPPDLGAFETCVLACPEPGAMLGWIAALGGLATLRRR